MDIYLQWIVALSHQTPGPVINYNSTAFETLQWQQPLAYWVTMNDM